MSCICGRAISLISASSAPRVHAAPAVPVRETEAIDHFGNRVSRLFLDQPHTGLEVTAEAVVDVEYPLPPDPAATSPWETVAQQAWDAGGSAWQAAEFVFDSPRAPADGGAKAYAAPCFAPGRTVLEALLDLNSCIRREFTFRAGVTSIWTPITQLFKRREGVCQDFSHLMIAGLRALGLPARYVSGYIRTYPAPGTTGLRGADQSHAWVGAWLGPEHGWVDVDPTNGIVVKDEHVLLGWGRDFSDVSPVRGVILGGGDQKLTVEVELRETCEPE